MFKIQEIREIIKLVDSSSIDEFVYEVDGAKVKLKKNNIVVTETVAPKKEVVAPVVQQSAPAEAPVAAPAKVEEAPAAAAPAINDPSLHKIVSPMVGTFYSAASPEMPSFVNVGDRVGEKTTVCIIEAMKLMNELEAEIKGEIVSVLAENGQLVEYGQPLFLVKPE